MKGPGIYGGTFRVRMTADAATLDPHVVTQTCEFVEVYHMYETVISANSTGSFYSQVCEYQINENSTELTLKVRDGVTFHDGSAVTADDIVASIERWMAKRSKAKTMFAPMFGSMEKKDDKTVQIHFKDPCPLALYVMSNPPQGCYVMKASQIKALGDGDITGFDKTSYIGTGPYKFEEWLPSQHILVSRYEDYKPIDRGNDPAADSLTATRYCYPDKIEFLPVTDNATGQMSLMSGELDFGFTLTAEQGKQIVDGGYGYQFFASMGYNPCIVFSNHPSRPDFVRDLNFRKALLVGMNMYDMMYAVTGGQTERMIMNPTPVAPGSIYDNTVGDDVWNKGDLELAKKYLADSCYKGEKIVFETRTNSDNYNAAVVMVDQLSAIGLNFDLVVVDSATASAHRNDHSGWDLAILNSPTVDPEPLAFNFINNGAWIGWESPKKVELANKLAAEGNIAKRQELYEQMCRLIYEEEIPYIPYGSYRSLYYYRTGIEGTFAGMYYYFWNSYDSAKK